MIRKKKTYVRPKKMYEKSRIEEENILVTKYSLKNKREIWKTLTKVNYYRSRAKSLSRASPDEQNVLFTKLQKIGLNVNSISDVLALKIEDLLSRRLPTILYKKKLATTTGQARQMVVHKNVLIDGKVVNIPSYIVSVAEETLITLKKKKKVAKVAPKEESPAQENSENIDEVKSDA
ncbi:30S ribosomal protein S4 [Candidatus Pacearchaeota archaeon CG10_big_fil_rev_8_21_14_0_10_31_24]|nr:MAG: 30S ribosomal protein S4 [Candidatus Pacearchaeota archaeon CG10_big_fil_rev_8_21_14_0_10_31_24]